VKWWKWLGVAGLAGVTATGVVIARAERRRRAYTPDEIRDRLHQRLAEAPGREAPSGGRTDAETPPRRRCMNVRIRLRSRPDVVHPESHSR